VRETTEGELLAYFSGETRTKAQGWQGQQAESKQAQRPRHGQRLAAGEVSLQRGGTDIVEEAVEEFVALVTGLAGAKPDEIEIDGLGGGAKDVGQSHDGDLSIGRQEGIGLCLEHTEIGSRSVNDEISVKGGIELLDSHRLRQIARLVDVGAAHQATW
jgi:hypothetical protein